MSENVQLLLAILAILLAFYLHAKLREREGRKSFQQFLEVILLFLKELLLEAKEPRLLPIINFLITLSFALLCLISLLGAFGLLGPQESLPSWLSTLGYAVPVVFLIGAIIVARASLQLIHERE